MNKPATQDARHKMAYRINQVIEKIREFTGDVREIAKESGVVDMAGVERYVLLPIVRALEEPTGRHETLSTLSDDIRTGSQVD